MALLSINQLTKQWVWYVWNLTSNSLLGNGTWSSFYIIANTHALTIGGSGSPSDPSVSPGWDGYIDEFVVFDRALLSAEIALILPQTFPVGLPALLDSNSAMAGAAYYPPSNVQSNAAHIMAAYSLTPMESYAQASNAHMMAAYSVNKSPVRVFPVNPPQRPSQSQGWKRTFPI